MTEEQYHQICQACDNILVAEDSSIERVSISWLHVIREHPEFLKNYEYLFVNKRNTGAINFILKFIISKIKYIYPFKWYLIRKPSFWTSSSEELEQFDIMFVSHFLNSSQAGKSKDPYYNDVINRFKNIGYSVGILLINHTELKSSEVVENWKNDSIPRIVLSPILPFFKELRIRRKLKKESIILQNKAKNQSSPFLKKILVKASQEAKSNNTCQNYRMTKQLESLFNKVKPKIIISTYEGHAYERIIFHSAKKHNKKTTCIAYQHAAIFKLQHAINRRLFNNYDPDFILTSGLIGKERLEKANKFKEIPISILGSDRGISEDDFSKNIVKPKNTNCLVLPEGTVNECKILFEFSIKCAINNPSVAFIWRLHPILNFETLKIKIPILKELPKNITLSNKTFEEDLLSANFAIYRGTTAIVKAISYRVKPIYFSIPDELTIDILYETYHWKKIVSNIEDFKKIIEEPFDDEDDFKHLLNYCNNLFGEFDLDKLNLICKDSLNKVFH